ncbi:MAG: hypothetical protein JW715_01550 [Sedimentisphaerales bacterium]|nr:hypothetical protein [Sedimentisphaerales bacterium]
MDLSNFTVIFQKLSFFKNKSLLIPVIISLIGILLFIPTQLMSSGLKEQVDKESVSVLARVRNLSKAAVSDELLDKETKQLQDQAEDANEIELLAKETTQRKLLVYNIFDVNDPNTLPDLIFLQFGQQYTGGIDKMIAESKSGDCPTEIELTRAIDESGAKSRALMPQQGRMMFDEPMMNPMSRLNRGAPGLRTMSKLERAVVDQKCMARAKEISFYVTPAQMSGYALWQNYNTNIQKVDAVEDCWYYQLAYWIIEDVFDTVNTLDSGYDNVLNAPVKRIMRVTFKMDSGFGGMRRTVRRGRITSGTQKEADNTDKPQYVLSDDKQSMLTETCTARYCDEDIDVVHFNLVCIVSMQDFMPFMEELCSAKEHEYIDESGQTHTYKHNQITIIETKISPVDREQADHLNYCYGDAGVIELDLVCEYIFKKNAYEDIKPESVKKTLLGEETE